jgi:hypothetical protein
MAKLTRVLFSSSLDVFFVHQSEGTKPTMKSFTRVLLSTLVAFRFSALLLGIQGAVDEEKKAFMVIDINQYDER